MHEFTLGDVEDPYLYAGFPISEWQQTEHGKWVMANVTEQPVFHITPDPTTFGYRVVITGELNSQAATYFTLKYR
jgi:hypothetical protein